MKILESLSDAEVRTLAGSKTPKPMPGTWVLIAPDGQTWTGDSPIKCVHAEIHSRVPPQVALARIRCSVMQEEDGDDAKRVATLPALPKPRVLASGTIAGKAIELRGWHTDDIEIWERQHGLKFGA